MTVAAPDDAPIGRARGTPLAIATVFAALAALTGAELKVAAQDGAPAARMTTLAGLLIFKVGLVLAFCLRASLRRRQASRLALLALIMAAVFAVVLMLEAAFQARWR